MGKTEKTLSIAQQLGVPIINADSRQIFREIPIGTAAPTSEQQRQVKHYFVGTHSLTDYYSAAQYEEDVLKLLDDLFRDIDFPTIDEEIRERMKLRLNKEGLPVLLDELKHLDPEHYAIVDHNNPRRVVHALEVCHMTGKTYTSFRKGKIKHRPFRIQKIGLNRPREVMYERINQRVLQMMSDGLEEKARHVYSLRELNSLNTVGFKELFKYFDGTIGRNEAIRQIQSNTRRYMRKQITWFQKDNTIHWYEPEEEIII